MKRYSKKTANIYGMISLLIIIGVIFAVGFSINRNNSEINDTGNKPSVMASMTNNTKKADKKIYNPYETVNFDTFNMTEKIVLSDTNITTSDNEFKSVLTSSEVYSFDSLEGFLGEVKGSDDLFAVASIYNTSSTPSNYVSLVKNKNIIGLEISEGKYLDKSLKVWDDVLTSVMPQLTVLGITKKIVLLTENEGNESERNAIISGHYFSISSASGANKIPEIESITIKDSVIRIAARNYTRIEWITENGKISGYGEEINPYATDIQQWNNANESVSKPSKYIRAVIIGEDGLLYTQAFGLQ